MGKILTKPIEHIALFMIMFLSCSFVVTNDIISSSITMGLWLMTLFALLWNSDFQYDVGIFCVFIVLALCMFLTVLLCQDNIINLFKYWFAIVVSLVYCNRVSFEDFKDSYKNVLFILSVVSLVCFALYMVFPALYQLNKTINSKGFVYSNLFFFVNTTAYTRNTGMFWEPGAFQTFINMALLLELQEKKVSLKRVAILVTTLITTFSTTGYLALIPMLLIFLYAQRLSIKTIVIGIVCIGIAAVLVNIFYDDLFGNADSVFGKILQYDKKGNALNGSTRIRYYSIVEPLKVYLNSPIFGRGYAGLVEATIDYTKTMNTCTFVNWFAIYGTLFGMLMLGGISALMKKITRTNFGMILGVVMFFIITMSEDYVHNPMVFLLVFYGYRECWKQADGQMLGKTKAIQSKYIR